MEQKEYKKVSVEGLPLIGAGANGAVYRLNQEQIIKVYNPLTNPMGKILQEKKTAKEAFTHGIPTAISFDMVQVDEKYGIIYEMIDAKTLGTTMSENPEQLDALAVRMAQLLKKLHSTEFEPGVLPDARDSLMIWVKVAERSGVYDDDLIDKMRDVVRGIPEGNTFVHGDFHPGNIMVSRDELLLIDMGESGVGSPLADLMCTFQIMMMMTRHEGSAMKYMSISNEQSRRVWNVFIREYLGDDDPGRIAALEQKLTFLGLIRTLAGLTFSKIVDGPEREGYIKQVAEHFLIGYEKMKEHGGL